MVPRTGPRSTSSALKTTSLYQAEKSSLCGVTPRSSRATCRGYDIGPARLPRISARSARREWPPSVDVELVALGVLHPHRVVIEAVGAQGSGERGPEIRQPPGLGVDSLLADLKRN